MNKFLKKIALYGLASFIVLNLIAFLSLFFLGKSCFYKQQFVQNGVKETNFDYVVLGSSTGLTTLDTKLIDSLTKKKGLNISIDDSGLSSHYLMLKHFYSSGKITKKLILAVMPEDFSNANPVINTNDYRFIPHIWNEEVDNYFNHLNGKNEYLYKIAPYFPLIPVSYYNTELFYPGFVSIFKPNNRYLFDDKGNFSYPILNLNKDLKKSIVASKKVEFKNHYLTKIIDFCAENKIEIILYQSPIYNVKVIFPDKISIINHSDLIKEEHYFFDKIHVNSGGRKICSIKFSESVFNQ